MAARPPQLASVTCPACRTHYTAQVHNVVDVGRDPRLKQMMLQGRINVGVCPNCGTAGMLSAPLTYHDPEKELLLCLVPQELRMGEAQRQRMIGEMSNAIISRLPAEQRRGYLLQPRVYLSIQTMLEAILEADGITRDMLQAQQQKLDLISTMLDVADDSIRLAALIGEHGDKIDYEFFSLLTLQISNAERTEQPDLAGKLTRLQSALLERTEAGQKVAQQQEAMEDALAGIDENLTREDLLEKIVRATGDQEDEILNVLVALARPLIDYQFFQLMTAQIDRATQQNDQQLVERLKSLREKVLDITQELDAQVRVQTQERVDLLSEILQSSQPRDTIRTHIDEIDDIFMSVLATSIAQNRQERRELAERLSVVQNLVVEVMQENAPPEVRFISQLLNAEYPNDTRQMLSNNQVMVTPEMLEVMGTLVGELAERGDAEASEKLNGILAQAKLLS